MTSPCNSTCCRPLQHACRLASSLFLQQASIIFFYDHTFCSLFLLFSFSAGSTHCSYAQSLPLPYEACSCRLQLALSQTRSLPVQFHHASPTRFPGLLISAEFLPQARWCSRCFHLVASTFAQTADSPRPQPLLFSPYESGTRKTSMTWL